MLALITGEGVLPGLVVDALDTRPFICALDGYLPDGVEPDLVFRIETLGTVLQTLKDRGVRQVCFTGAIRRPSVDPSLIDAATWPLVPMMQQAILTGDDGALRAVISVVESAGFEVIGAHDVAPGLLPPTGMLTQAKPGERDEKDAARGMSVLATMSEADLGQACVVQAGQVLVVEGSYGTDWMLNSLAARPDGTTGGVLCKAPKAGQDRRADLPAIGPGTIAGLQAAGLCGVVIEAGGVMVLGLEAVLTACDAAGMFLWVRPPDTP